MRVTPGGSLITSGRHITGQDMNNDSSWTAKIKGDREAGHGQRAERVVQIDTLKVLLVAWIIACHALLGYTAIGGWPYDEVNEVAMSPRAEFALSVALARLRCS